MRWRRVQAAGEEVGRKFDAAGVWLRGVMPRVAVAAVVLLVARLLLGRTFLYGDHAFGAFMRVATLCVVVFTFVYYNLRALLWLKRKLLWRVRRRLVITYLFIGLTPIVLLGLLGLLSALVISGQAMSRIVTVQINSVERQALADAHALAEGFARLPPATNERGAQAWLDERAALLQASLPGARVAVWRESSASNGAVGDDGAGVSGVGESARFVAEPEGEETRGVGGDQTPVGAPLPEWLRGRAEWSGFAFMPPPEDSSEPFGTPSMRALVRREEGGQKLALLVVVPVSRALVRQFADTGGIRLNPYFFGAENMEGQADGRGVRITRSSGRQAGLSINRDDEGASGDNREARSQLGLDQFGDPLPSPPYGVISPATNWLTGETDQRLSFIFNLSLTATLQQFLESTAVGVWLRSILLTTATIFLALEALALVAAALMTRAVTGTVHKLYRATEYIKRGDFSHRVRVRSNDQLGELAAAFNDMSANIESLLHERVKHERLEREVEIAAEVQAQLFPRSVPHLETLAITGECRAARGVAGDYYDYIKVAPGLVAFALGDVSGKGISASLVMSNLQASLRAQTTIIAERLRLTGRSAAPATAAVEAAAATTAVRGVGDGGVGSNSSGVVSELPCGVTGIDTQCAVENMVASINEQLCRSTEANRFATLFLALYDEPTRTLRYTNAGHNAPMLVRADDTLERLDIGGMMTGAFDFATYEEASTRLDPGDLLLVFSDGITEAQNADGEEYGETRLAQLTVARRQLSPDDLRRTIFDEIDRWSGATERGDDQTLVIVKAGAVGR